MSKSNNIKIYSRISNGSHHNSVQPWKKPQLGWYKLNVDGPEKSNLIAMEGVIRSDQGIWITGFGKFLGMENVDLAKAWSLQIRLQLVSSLNIKKLEIETDFQEIYNLLTCNANEIHSLSIITSNCRQLFHSFKGVRLIKI